MCGRFAVTLPTDAMAQLFDALPANDLPEVPDYNVCPTTRIATVRAEEGQRRLAPMRWGFLPQWYKSPTDGPLLINARGETAATKASFRAPMRHKRALIPASGFYEWKRDKASGQSQAYWVRPANGGHIAPRPRADNDHVKGFCRHFRLRLAVFRNLV